MMSCSSPGVTAAVGPELSYPTNSGYSGQDYYNLGRSLQPPFPFYAHRSDSGPYYSTAHYVYPVYFALRPPPPYQRRISVFLRKGTNADIWRCARFLVDPGGLMNSSPMWGPWFVNTSQSSFGGGNATCTTINDPSTFLF